MNFFWNFLPRAEYERNSGQKVFSRFLSLSHQFLAKNNGGKSFFNFLIFFLFFWKFLARVEYEQNLGLKFFCLFFGLSHPVLATKNAGKRFFNFLNFFAIFFGIFFLGRV